MNPLEKMDLASWDSMAAEIAASCDLHRLWFGDAVTGLLRHVATNYECQIDGMMKRLYGNRSHMENIRHSRDALVSYLLSMQWVGWGDCEFGPPLGLADDAGIYALSLIAYLGARLLDDAIDRHLDYKGRFPSFYGFLAGEFGEHKAAEISAAAGNFLITASIRHMIKKESFDAAAEVMRLFSRVAAGVLCETLSGGIDVSPGLYRSVVRHKAVAYDRILHVVFFRKAEPIVRNRILSFLSLHSAYSQWLNDLLDEADDRSRNQMSILNVSGMNREKVLRSVLEAFQKLWKENRDLHPDIRNAMAIRLNDSLKKIEQISPFGK